jgi:predicted sulfurtransferase
MISLDLTRQASVDKNKPHLVKGRDVSLCFHCHRSVSRKSLLRCNECRHDFCPNCLDACRCYTQGGFRITVRRPRQEPHLELVTGAVPRVSRHQ